MSTVFEEVKSSMASSSESVLNTLAAADESSLLGEVKSSAASSVDSVLGSLAEMNEMSLTKNTVPDPILIEEVKASDTSSMDGLLNNLAEMNEVSLSEGVGIVLGGAKDVIFSGVDSVTSAILNVDCLGGWVLLVFLLACLLNGIYTVEKRLEVPHLMTYIIFALVSAGVMCRNDYLILLKNDACKLYVRVNEVL